MSNATEPDLQRLHESVERLCAQGRVDEALADAVQAVERARRELGENHPAVAAAREDLARVNEQRVAATLGPLAVASIPQELPALAAQAMFLQSRGRYAEAVPFLGRHLQLVAQLTGDPPHPIHARALVDLAEALWQAGDRASAQPLLAQALAMYRQSLGDSHPHAAATAHELGRLLLESGDDVRAEPLLQEALDSLRLAYAADTWSRCAYLLSLLPHLADGCAAANVGLDLILRRKGLVAESVILQRTAILGGAHPELVPSLKELDGLRARIAAATLGSEGAGRHVDAQQITAWIDRVESLESALARQIPEMTLQQRLRVADRASVAAALPREAVLLEFVRVSPFDFDAVVAHGERQWRPARYVAFVLACDAPDAVRRFDLGEADAIDAKASAFRESITGTAEPVVPVAERASPTNGAAETRGAIRDATRHLGAARKPKGTSQDAHAQGEALRAAVLDPLLPALGGRTRLVLAPDGDLARLPFEVLPLSATSRMIDVYEINYVTTGRDVLRFGAATGDRVARALVAGDPGFDLGTSPGQASGSPFGRLAGSAAEGRQVAAMLGVQPLLANAVLETPLKAGRGPAILHLATHGFFLPDLPRDANSPGDGMTSAMGLLTARPVANPLLRSGLALAGANTWLAGSDPPAEAEDGLLMAEDVAGMDLLDTELVVLSACDTGLGDIRAGEGVFGLRRAFAQAGARTLVMSLWKVRDHETQDLMADFYGRILNGEPRAQALRSAQLAVKTRQPDPLYWGAFICQGDPGPLSAPLCA